MMFRRRHLLAAVVGLWMAHPGLAEEPAPLNVHSGRALAPRLELSGNQKVANTVASHLRQSGQLHGYTIDVVFLNGTAELQGVVADQLQREEAVRIVQGVPGVERVRNGLQLAGYDVVTRAQATAPVPPDAVPSQVPPPAPNAPPGTGVEPAPIFQAPMPNPMATNPPPMPPYAWPTYAPYNNYSRVAYPKIYPYQSWPFIGPVDPFPKIPLGWRHVTLEWDDGHWFYATRGNSHCWWQLRYW